MKTHEEVMDLLKYTPINNGHVVIEQFEKEIRKDQMDKSARAVKFSSERFFHNGKQDSAIMITDAIEAIREK
jgi:hypothetical protein